MSDRGKKYQQAAALVERGRTYEPDQAMELLKQTTYVGFAASAQEIQDVSPTDGRVYTRSPHSRLFRKPWWKFW